MRVTELKKGEAYAYHSTNIQPQNRPFRTATAVIVLDNRNYSYWRPLGAGLGHQWKATPGPKKLGWDELSRIEVAQVGIPCLVAQEPGHVHNKMPWSFALVPARKLWGPWGDISSAYAYKSKYELHEREKREREAAHEAMLAAYNAVALALTSIPGSLWSPPAAWSTAKYIRFDTTDQMNWLADFINNAHELEEELKDLRYELED